MSLDFGFDYDMEKNRPNEQYERHLVDTQLCNLFEVYKSDFTKAIFSYSTHPSLKDSRPKDCMSRRGVW